MSAVISAPPLDQHRDNEEGSSLRHHQAPSSSSSSPAPTTTTTTAPKSSNHLEIEGIDRIRDIFKEIDVNGDGVLSQHELTEALRSLGLPTGPQSIKEMFAHIDRNNDGEICFEEFARFVDNRRQRLREVFDSICRSELAEEKELERGNNTSSSSEPEALEHHSPKRSTFFSAKNLRAAAEEANVRLSDTDIRRIMKQFQNPPKKNFRLANKKDQQDRDPEEREEEPEVKFEDFLDALLLAPSVNPGAFFDDTWFVDTFVYRGTPTDLLQAEIRPHHHHHDKNKTSEDSKTTDKNAQSSSSSDETFSQMAVKKLTCGALSGCLSRTITAPVDRIRMLMMTSDKPISIVTAIRIAVDHPRGFWALWIGNGINCIKVTPEMAIKLFTFDVLRKWCAADPDNVTAFERFMSGGVAGAVAQTMVYPCEVFRTRLGTAAPGTYNGVFHCGQLVVKTGGFRALYAGLTPSICGIIPFAGIDLTVMSLLKDKAAKHLAKQDREVSVPLLLASGMISASVATAFTFPLNVIRTKAQATGDPITAVVKQMNTEGFRAYYRGVVPCLAKIAPATAVSYAAYDWMQRRWPKQWQGQ